MPNQRITEAHLEVYKEMIEEALEKAARSMGQMLRIRMKYDLMDFGQGLLEPIEEFDHLGRFKVNIVKVAFSGEIKGAFYFIINVHETELINKVCLPENMVTTRTSETTIMKNDFMTEIENLIASMSITEISEFLGVQLKMEVPQMRSMKGEEVNEYLDNQNHVNRTEFFVKSALKGVVVNISPYFIWMIDEKFIEVSSQNIVV
jgi:chemotaxis protein CheY-P-specific phosphatase CheC